MPVENWLVNMLIDEVSLVPEGENPLALIDIVKAKNGKVAADAPMLAKFGKLSAIIKEAHARRAAEGTLGEISAGFDALRDKLDATLADEGLTPVQKAKMIAENFDEFRVALNGLAPNAVIAKAVVEAMVTITKGDDPAAIMREISMDATELREALTAAETALNKANGRVTELETAATAQTAEIAVLKKAAKVIDPNDDAAVFEGMTPVAIEKFKRIQAENVANSVMLAKMADDQGIAVEVGILKAKGIAKPDEVGAALYRIKKGKPAAASTKTVDGKEVAVPSDADIVEQALFAKVAAARTNLKVVGVGNVEINKGSGEDDAGDDPLATLDAKAIEIAKARSISKDAAMVFAMDENPELYQRFVAVQKQKAASGA